MAAARILAAVVDAKTPLDGLTDNEHGHPQFRALEGRDRALTKAILTTALRFRTTIDALIQGRLDRPLPANATTLQHILHVGAAQMLFLDIPDSAAVDLAVSHAKSDPRTLRFAGLVNAVLRGLGREKDAALAEALVTAPAAPLWFEQRLTADYGAKTAKAILAAHRVEAPVDFTVKGNADDWARQLGGVVLPTGTVRVAKLTAAVPELPGFNEGAWWVQDAAAALPARLFGDVRGKRVADLCAAPGGKTAQLALAGAHVTAVDSSKNRLARLESNLDRVGLSATLVNADALTYAPEELFDAVLLDAPCSSTGTVRRHPDVPWTKSLQDIAKLADLQRRMLERSVRLVKPGGVVVFSNCSLDKSEGEHLFKEFLAGNKDIVAFDPISALEFEGIESFVHDGMLRTVPADLEYQSAELSGLDGFFAARLVVCKDAKIPLAQRHESP